MNHDAWQLFLLLVTAKPAAGIFVYLASGCGELKAKPKHLLILCCCGHIREFDANE
jgi:hypothetical protein